jgi:hypothetical protein
MRRIIPHGGLMGCLVLVYSILGECANVSGGLIIRGGALPAANNQKSEKVFV